MEVTSSSSSRRHHRPRRAATLRRAVSVGGAAASGPGGHEAPEGRRRSTRSLSAYNQSNSKYQPPKGQDVQVRRSGDHVV